MDKKLRWKLSFTNKTCCVIWSEPPTNSSAASSSRFHGHGRDMEQQQNRRNQRRSNQPLRKSNGVASWAGRSWRALGNVVV
jgi:hypothetical protein